MSPKSIIRHLEVVRTIDISIFINGGIPLFEEKIASIYGLLLGIFTIIIPLIITYLPLISILEIVGHLSSLILSVVVLTMRNYENDIKIVVGKMCGVFGGLITILILVNDFI